MHLHFVYLAYIFIQRAIRVSQSLEPLAVKGLAQGADDDII